MKIRSGQSGELGVMYSDGLHTVSCRKRNEEVEYLITMNESISPWIRNIPVIRVFEKLRFMFRNTHDHVHFLKGSKIKPKLIPFYLRFVLFMIVVAPIYMALMWFVLKLTENLPFFWLELLIEAIFMYGLFMLVASKSMSARSKRYHSAEHQAVNAWLAIGNYATKEDALISSRFHPSCGTGAAFSVAVGVFITLLIFYTFVPVPDFYLYAIYNFCLFPLGVSVGMELFSFIPFLYRKTGLTILVYPSYLLQRFTTSKATLEEIEIAWFALEKIRAIQTKHGD